MHVIFHMYGTLSLSNVRLRKMNKIRVDKFCHYIRSGGSNVIDTSVTSKLIFVKSLISVLLFSWFIPNKFYTIVWPSGALVSGKLSTIIWLAKNRSKVHSTMALALHDKKLMNRCNRFCIKTVHSTLFIQQFRHKQAHFALQMCELCNVKHR